VLYVNINVKTFIGGAVCRSVRIGGADGRRNVTPCRMQQRTVQFFRMCLESGDGSGTFRNWRSYIENSLNRVCES